MARACASCYLGPAEYSDSRYPDAEARLCDECAAEQQHEELLEEQARTSPEACEALR